MTHGRSGKTIRAAFGGLALAAALAPAAHAGVQTGKGTDASGDAEPTEPARDLVGLDVRHDTSTTA